MRQQNKVKNIIKDVKGITLIALVITIIVLLILAGITLSLTFGDNGILNRVEEAQIRADIAETKELIKLEIMGNVDQKAKYTNKNIMDAVKKITDNEIEENTPIIKSKKGNDVDISDLWIVSESYEISFTIDGKEFKAMKGMNWLEWASEYLESAYAPYPADFDYFSLNSSFVLGCGYDDDGGETSIGYPGKIFILWMEGYDGSDSGNIYSYSLFRGSELVEVTSEIIENRGL